MSKIKSFFIEKFNNYNFILYPLASLSIKSSNANGMFGTIAPSKEKFDEIVNKLIKSKCTYTTSKVYIYRDMEFHIIDPNIESKLNQVIKKEIIYVDSNNDHLLVISKNDVIDNDAFPRLNKYNDEYEKKLSLYKFGSVNLNLISQNDGQYRHIEISFQYKKGNIDNLVKDIDYVCELLSLSSV